MNKLRSLMGFAIALLLSSHTHASLIGDDVNATIIPNYAGTINQQFSSPATVGTGTEFTGSYTDGFSQQWSFIVDFDAYQFTIGFNSDNDYGNIRALNSWTSFINFNFSNLNWGGNVTSVLNTGYSCSLGKYCSWGKVYPSISSISFTNDSINIGFNGLFNGDRFTFTANTNSVPEPTPLALLVLGIIGIGGARLRRK